jgi:predicted amidohydrolase YtcJ
MDLLRTALRLLTLTAGAAALAGCGPGEAPPEPADLVLLNGRIVTVDEGRPEVEALAARGDAIVALGTTAEVEAYVGDGTEVVDLGGRLAVPGFIEGHGHFLSLGDSRLQLDLRTARSWDEIVGVVRRAAAEASPGEWIRGRGWHQDKWDEVPEPNVEGFPLHDGLSAAAPDNPVLLTHASGHALFANSKAMELAGIDAGTPDPEGGEILRDPRGRPTGLFRENAEELIDDAREDTAGEAEERKKVQLASEECLAKGVTSFQDAGSSFEKVEFLHRMAAEGVLGMRLWIMVREDPERLRSKLGEVREATRGDRRVTVGGIKISLDGALGSRGAWLLEPYSDSPESTGLNTVSLEQVRETAAIAADHGVQLCIHAIGDRANREVLDVYEETFAAHPEKTDLRWRIEHAQHLHPDDIPRFAELGVIAAMQPVHCTSDGPWVPDRLGEKRSAEGAYVWRKLLDSGAVIVSGTDTPVEDVDPIANFYAAVTRRMGNGEVFYGDQRMTRMEALRSMTLDAAYGVFEEEIKGSLAVGKLADVVVLSQDILTVAEEDIPATEVDLTIVGGEVAYRRAS